ncbi:MAG: hemerythrin domain-containing protein [Myxococcaceae bacterium]|nr:hemerythrin domain-containing protein [Myxococcaceae bacterium]
MTNNLDVGPVFHPSEPVADLVLEHSAIPQVLRQHHIDFSVRGHLSLQELCELNGIPVEVVLNDLERAVKQPNHNPRTDPRDMSPAALMFHIVARHHSYLRDVLSIAVGLALKVERVHEGRDFPLKRIRELAQELRSLLEPHIEHEEVILFPALLENTLTREELAREAQDSKIDHERTAALFTVLRQLTLDYTPPEWACASTRGLFHQLEGLEADTLEHVHLENFVLFPKIAAAHRARAAST